MKTKTGMLSPIIVPTYGTWPTTPRIAQAPWSQGVPLTRSVVGKGMQLQDASDLTKRRSVILTVKEVAGSMAARDQVPWPKLMPTDPLRRSIVGSTEKCGACDIT